MKTLDEVIDDLRDRMGFGDPVLVDAIHYLKEYRTHKEDIAAAQDELSAFHCWLKEQEKDKLPLTFDELKQMVGKPVWVEMVGFSLGGYPMSWKYWAIVSLCDEEILRIVHDQFENLDLADEELGVWNANAIWDMPKEDYGKTWQAYRRERHG